ncbi:MAG: hypothetical protein CMJ58_11210 [Planctomycetaceae bacterium]|nr:hypothetical protein [Planctomycetaceae bacterium]
MAFAPALRVISTHVSGYSVSSAYELRLVRETVREDVHIQLISPYAPPSTIAQLSSSDAHILNSERQLLSQADSCGQHPQLGLRLNAGLSFADDDRYNPGRPHSKLGVPLPLINSIFSTNPHLRENLSGFNLHHNCESNDFRQLLELATRVSHECRDALDAVDWINVGGGYTFESDETHDHLRAAVDVLRRHKLQVYVEPGAAFVRSAAYLVATVVDKITREGREILILDTTVNHLPEVFEYQFSPDVLGAIDEGDYKYTLAGCSCLAGDLFGDYCFADEKSVGERIVFENVGDYTTTKWHYFNGINHPSIYRVLTDGRFVLEKEFTYEEFAARNGGNTYAAV